MTTKTNTERLEDIKQWHEDDGELHQFEIDWLIEQAEHAQQLEQQLSDFCRASMKALQVTAYPKSSQKIFIRQCFEDFWEPELVNKLKALDGEQT